MLCQFTHDGDKKTLADFVHIKGVYPTGRLDFDSEGLVLLTDDGPLQHRLTDPRFAHPRTYWVQVEGEIHTEAIDELRAGVMVVGRKTLPCSAEALTPPLLPERHPPVRFRKSIPTSWLSLTLIEGRNRQVRHMTAMVGFPTLRLVRVALGGLTLQGLQPGEWRKLSNAEVSALQR